MSKENLKQTYNNIAEDWHRDHQSDDWWIEGTDTDVVYEDIHSPDGTRPRSRWLQMIARR